MVFRLLRVERADPRLRVAVLLPFAPDLRVALLAGLVRVEEPGLRRRRLPRGGLRLPLPRRCFRLDRLRPDERRHEKRRAEGKDKGERGTVLRVIDAEHVLVEGRNKVKKHQRPNPMKGITGGIIDKEMPIHVSNVALFNPASKKADRVGIKVLENGRRVRYFKSNGEVVDA